MGTPLVAMRGIGKHFGGLQAVSDVSLDLHSGEVLGIVGHNGAGKSVLMQILSGVYPMDSGDIQINGKTCKFNSPRDARDNDIETIYQTLALADNLDAVANLFLGRELKSRFGLLDERRMFVETEKVIGSLNPNFKNLREPVNRLSGGQRQSIAIARAVYFNAKVLIMDEPTAALGPHETRMVAELIEKLKAEGLGIILISHDLHDVFDLSDRILVMKGGHTVATCITNEVSKDEVLQLIIAGQTTANTQVH